MEVGDTVALASDKDFRGTVVKLPGSIGRKRPRVLIRTISGEQWLYMDELVAIQPEQE